MAKAKTSAKKTTAIKTKAKKTPASPDAVAVRAYEIWEGEGRPEGRAEANWVQAEQELRQ
jgi:hypothetical protein